MATLPLRKIVVAVARNQAHRFGIARAARKIFGRKERGGEPWSRHPVAETVRHVVDIWQLLRPHAGDVRGQVGVEIGPGDNLGVAYCFLKDGARRVYAVEKLASVAVDDHFVSVLRALDSELGDSRPSADDVLTESDGVLRFDEDRLKLCRTFFEDLSLPEPVDFIYSNDVLAHVRDLPRVYRNAFAFLKPGGLFINNVDLRGQNVFSDHSRPLDFLTCGDGLWRWMFSHIETTNRVRSSDLHGAAAAAGFDTVYGGRLAEADPAYLSAVRPHLRPRYRDLTDEDLSVLQYLLVVRKPG